MEAEEAEGAEGAEEFKAKLVSTYSTIIDIIKLNGRKGVVSFKRQETYRKAIDIVNEINLEDFDNLDKVIEHLKNELTLKPRKVMEQMIKNDGLVILEDKEPYYSAQIKNGTIVGENNVDVFKELSKLTGIGIGIGPSGIKELMEMGIKSIDELKEIYKKDKFASFRKGLKGPLIKYFTGMVHDSGKNERNVITKWKEIIDKVISGFDVKFGIAGSYYREASLVGDIDYVVVAKNNVILYESMIGIMEGLKKNIKTLLTEKDPKKGDECVLKAWIIGVGGAENIKIEIYGYSGCSFEIAHFARSAETELQKKIRYHANRLGYKLSATGLYHRENDKIVDGIDTLDELFKKLDWKG